MIVTISREDVFDGMDVDYIHTLTNTYQIVINGCRSISTNVLDIMKLNMADCVAELEKLKQAIPSSIRSLIDDINTLLIYGYINRR